jgi:hypothetical protein
MRLFPRYVMSAKESIEAQSESVGWTVVENLLADSGSDTDRLTLDEILSDVRSGARDSGGVVRELEKRPRTRPGEFGIEGVSSMLVGLVIPAAFQFLKIFTKKFIEKSGEVAAEKSLAMLLAKKLGPDPENKAVWEELDASFARRAKELGLPQSSYREMLEHFRADPQHILKPRLR